MRTGAGGSSSNALKHVHWTLIQTEGALRWQARSAAVMVEQVEYLIQLSTTPHVQLGVIDWRSPVEVFPHTAFHLYDEAAAPPTCCRTCGRSPGCADHRATNASGATPPTATAGKDIRILDLPVGRRAQPKSRTTAGESFTSHSWATRSGSPGGPSSTSIGRSSARL